MDTQACKPKGARTYRALYISPPGAAPQSFGGMPQPYFGGMPQPYGGDLAMGAVAPVAQPGMPVATATVMPAMTTMAVTVPDGVMPGGNISIAAPDGRVLQVGVPQGVGPGQVFHAQVPASAPVVAQATVVAVA